MFEPQLILSNHTCTPAVPGVPADAYSVVECTVVLEHNTTNPYIATAFDLDMRVNVDTYAAPAEMSTATVSPSASFSSMSDVSNNKKEWGVAIEAYDRSDSAIIIDYTYTVTSGCVAGTEIVLAPTFELYSMPSSAANRKKYTFQGLNSSITINSPSMSVNISETSSPSTGFAAYNASSVDLSIGEVCVLEIEVHLPEGVTKDLEVHIAITNTSALLSIEAHSITDKDASLTYSAPTATATANTIQYTVGTVTHAGTNPVAADSLRSFTIAVSLLVGDVEANTDGDVVDIEVLQRWSTGQNTEHLSLELVEPVVVAQRTASNATGDAFDEILFTVTIECTAESTASAVNVNYTDAFSGFVDTLVNTGISTSAGSVVEGDTAGDATLTVFIAEIKPGQTVTITYTGHVALEVRPDTTLSSNSSVQWRSHHLADVGRDYGQALSNSFLTHPPTSAAFFLANTSLVGTTPLHHVTVGEMLDFALDIVLMEGVQTIQTVVELPLLPGGVLDGMCLVSAELAAIGAQLTSSATDLTQGTSGVLTDRNGDGSNDTIAFHFVNITNTGDNAVDEGDVLTVSIRVTAVANEPLVVSGTVLSAKATTTYASIDDPTRALASETQNVTIITSELVFTQDQNVSVVDAGDVVAFSVSLSHGLASAAPAYGVAISDHVLTGDFTIDNGTIAVSHSEGMVYSVQSTEGFHIVFEQMGLEDSVNVTWQARAKVDIHPAEAVASVHNITWNSAEGDTITVGSQLCGLSNSPMLSVTYAFASPALSVLSLDIASTSIGTTQADMHNASITDLSIGETIVLLMKTELIEGRQDVVMTVEMGSDIAFSIDVLEVAYIGTHITPALLSTVGSAGQVSGTNAVFDFGSVLNSYDNAQTLDDELHVRVTATVTDTGTNTDNEASSISAQVGYDNGGTLRVSNAIPVEVVEPALVMVVTSVQSENEADFINNFTATITNPTSHAAAFAVNITLDLDEELSFLAGSVGLSANNDSLVINYRHSTVTGAGGAADKGWFFVEVDTFDQLGALTVTWASRISKRVYRTISSALSMQYSSSPSDHSTGKPYTSTAASPAVPIVGQGNLTFQNISSSIDLPQPGLGSTHVTYGSLLTFQTRFRFKHALQTALWTLNMQGSNFDIEQAYIVSVGDASVFSSTTNLQAGTQASLSDEDGDANGYKEQAVFDFGNVTDLADGLYSDKDAIVAEFKVRVKDTQNPLNSFEAESVIVMSIDGEAFPAAITTRILRPELEFKSITFSAYNGSAADEYLAEVTVRHTDDSAANATDILVSDSMHAEGFLGYVPASIAITEYVTAGDTASVSIQGGSSNTSASVAVSIPSLLLGEEASFSYRVFLLNAVFPGLQVTTQNLTLDWHSGSLASEAQAESYELNVLETPAVVPYITIDPPRIVTFLHASNDPYTGAEQHTSSVDDVVVGEEVTIGVNITLMHGTFPGLNLTVHMPVNGTIFFSSFISGEVVHVGSGISGVLPGVAGAQVSAIGEQYIEVEMGQLFNTPDAVTNASDVVTVLLTLVVNDAEETADGRVLQYNSSVSVSSVTVYELFLFDVCEPKMQIVPGSLKFHFPLKGTGLHNVPSADADAGDPFDVEFSLEHAADSTAGCHDLTIKYTPSLYFEMVTSSFGINTHLNWTDGVEYTVEADTAALLDVNLPYLPLDSPVTLDVRMTVRLSEHIEPNVNYAVPVPVTFYSVPKGEDQTRYYPPIEDIEAGVQTDEPVIHAWVHSTSNGDTAFGELDPDQVDLAVGETLRIRANITMIEGTTTLYSMFEMWNDVPFLQAQSTQQTIAYTGGNIDALTLNPATDVTVSENHDYSNGSYSIRFDLGTDIKNQYDNNNTDADIITIEAVYFLDDPKGSAHGTDAYYPLLAFNTVPPNLNGPHCKYQVGYEHVDFTGDVYDRFVPKSAQRIDVDVVLPWLAHTFYEFPHPLDAGNPVVGETSRETLSDVFGQYESSTTVYDSISEYDAQDLIFIRWDIQHNSAFSTADGYNAEFTYKIDPLRLDPLMAEIKIDTIEYNSTLGSITHSNATELTLSIPHFPRDAHESVSFLIQTSSAVSPSVRIENQLLVAYTMQPDVEGLADPFVPADFFFHYLDIAFPTMNTTLVSTTIDNTTMGTRNFTVGESSVNKNTENDSNEDGISVGEVSLNETSVDETSVNGTSPNGTSLNGTSLNGTNLNETSLNGTSVNETSLNESTVIDTNVNETSLNETSLRESNASDSDSRVRVNESLTVPTELVVGERITFQVSLYLTESSTQMKIGATPPEAAFTITRAAVIGFGATLTGSALALGDVVDPYTRTDSSATIYNDTVVFDFVEVVNPSNNIKNANDTVKVEIEMVLIDNAGTNMDGQTGSIALHTEFSGIGNSFAEILTHEYPYIVREPSLALSLSTPANACTYDAGDIINYTSTLTHADNSTASAYKLNYSVAFASHFEVIEGSVLVSGYLNASDADADSVLVVVDKGNEVGATEVSVLSDALPRGESLTVFFKLRVLGSNRPSTRPETIATLLYYSHVNGSESAYAREYAVGAKEDICMRDPSVTGELLGTSLIETTSDQHEAGRLDLSIAEIVTYDYTLTLIEGTQLVNVTLSAELDGDGELDAHASEVISIGCGISNTVIGVSDSAALVDDNADTFHDRFHFHFGHAVTNAPTPNNTEDACDTIVVRVSFKVSNHDGAVAVTNTDASLATHTGVLTWEEGSVNATPAVFEGEIVEPDLALNASTNWTGGDAGDVVWFNLELEHTRDDGAGASLSLSTAAAYVVIARGNLTDAVVFREGSFTNANGVLRANSEPIDYIFPAELYVDVFELNETAALRYACVVQDSVFPATTYTLVSTVTYTSHSPYNGSEERVYSVSDSTSFTTDAPTVSHSTTSSIALTNHSHHRSTSHTHDTALGETVSQRIVLALTEGQTTITLTIDAPDMRFLNSLVTVPPHMTSARLSDGSSGNITEAEERLVFVFGTVSNPSLSNFPRNDTITIDCDLRLKEGANIDGDQRELSYVFDYTTGTLTGRELFDVVEPVLRISIYANASESDACDAGDVIVFRLSVEHDAASSTAPAFNLSITDLFADAVQLLPGSVTHASSFPSWNSQLNTSVIDVRSGNGPSDATLDVFLTTLELGQSLNITYTALLANSISTHARVDFQGVVDYASSPLAAERDDVRRYQKKDSTFITSLTPAFALSLHDTSIASTASSRHSAEHIDVTIGEVITLTLTASLTEGTGMVYVYCDAPDNATHMHFLDSEVVALGGSLRLDNTTTNVSAPGDAGVLVDVSGDGYSSRAVFDVGTVLNIPDSRAACEAGVGDAEDDIMVHARVAAVDEAGNTDGTVLTIDCFFRYFDAMAGANAELPLNFSLEIVEPLLEIALTASETDSDAGDVVVMNVVVQHTAASSAAAFDVRITHVLEDLGMTAVPIQSASSNNSTAPNVTEGATAGDTRLTVHVDTLYVGDVFNVTYVVMVKESVQPLQLLYPAVSVLYASNPHSATTNGSTRTRSATAAQTITVPTSTFRRLHHTTSLPETNVSRHQPSVEDLAIGEYYVIYYECTLVEGTTPITFTVDAAADPSQSAVLEVVKHEVVQVGSSISFNSTAAETVFLDEDGDGWSEKMTVSLGRVLNAYDNDNNENDTLTVAMTVRFIDDDQTRNTDGAVRDVCTTFDYGLGNASVTDSVELVHAELEFSFSQNNTEGDAGDLILFQLNITHLPSSSSYAYNLSVSEIVYEFLIVDADTFSMETAHTPVSYNLTRVGNDTTLSIQPVDLPPDDYLIVTYTAVVGINVYPAAKIETDAAIQWTSAPSSTHTHVNTGAFTRSETFLVDLVLSELVMTSTNNGTHSFYDAEKLDITVEEIVTVDLVITLIEGTTPVQIVLECKNTYG